MSEDRVTLDGLVSGETLEKTYKKRHAKYNYKTVAREEVEANLQAGWERTGSRNRKRIRLRRLRDIGPGFEDEVWCIFKRMGFTEMNKDRTFKVPVYSNRQISKQIDVYAKDDKCICFVECKSAEAPHTRRQLDKDIGQIAAIRHDIELSAFSHYRDPGRREHTKFRAVWILALKNIDMSDNDQSRAESARIKVLDSKQVEYYSSLTEHLGRSSKYQFLADLLPGVEIPELLQPVTAMKGRLGDAEFYSFVMEPAELLKIAYVAHRAKSTEESITTYQRMVKKARLKRIAEYIHERKGIFPTSIVINIQTDKPLRFDQSKTVAGKNASVGTLYIPNKYKTAWVIDGQHRLFAYADLEEANTATLPVIAFVDLDPDRHAQLFVDINGEQVKVPKNLLSDLWATIHWHSNNPADKLKALSARLVKALDTTKTSPLRDRIIPVEGKGTKTKNITLTALTDEIRKRQLLGTVKSQKSKSIEPGPLFDSDLDRTLVRARDLIAGYFQNYLALNKGFEAQWNLGSGEGGYVCTNSGLIALLRVMAAILDHLQRIENTPVRSLEVRSLLESMKHYQEPLARFLGDADPKVIRTFRERHGEGGFTACAYSMMWEINKAYSSFNPPGLRAYIDGQDTSKNPEGYTLVTGIERETLKYVIRRLKERYGDGLQGWWHNGVPNSVRQRAVQEGTNRGQYDRFERYLYLIDLKEIILENFDLLGETLTLDAAATDSKKKRVHWLDELNDIRNIVDHPPQGSISTEQLEHLRRIYDQLLPRLTS